MALEVLLSEDCIACVCILGRREWMSGRQSDASEGRVGRSAEVWMSRAGRERRSMLYMYRGGNVT